ncbi:MAG: fumarylacetoacetate hydrolase family protein [Blautia sp.]
MKLLTYRLSGEDKEYLGVMCSKVPDHLIPLEEGGLCFRDMNDLIATITEEQWEVLKELEKKSDAKMYHYDEIVHCAPIPRPKQDIICLGMNFGEHEKESVRYKKEEFHRSQPYAVYFSKRVNEAVPDRGEVPSHRGLVDSLDYEAELAVIIGKDARNVKREEAFDYVFGYTVMNDISARNIQTRHKQWYFGKSLDGFTPMGPWIVTEDEIQRPPKLAVKSRVNKELRQSGTTERFIFDIPHVIQELSGAMTLQKGTIIAMGTPAGVGMGMVPPRFLNPGDIVECGIEGIGYIRNKIV